MKFKGRLPDLIETSYYYISCLHSFRTENILKPHENVCKNHDYCHVNMPEEFEKALKYNHGQKSSQIPFVIYADTESFL